MANGAPSPQGPSALQVPSVGRIVHVRLEGACMAALVLGVDEPGDPDSTLTLFVFAIPPAHTSFYLSVEVKHGDQDGSWHWPEYVPPVQGVTP